MISLLNQIPDPALSLIKNIPIVNPVNPVDPIKNKKRILFSFLAALFFLPALAQAQIDVYSRPVQAERSHDFDVQHYRIKLRFDESTKSMWGETTITLVALKDDFVRAALDAETFTVDAVSDKSGATLPFQHSDGVLEIQLANSIDYGDTTVFTVIYSGTGVDVNPEEFGMSAGYDLGLDFKAETEDNPQLINTLSFPEGARHWFPCYDHPNDKATSEMIVTVRKDYNALSNGKLLSVTENATNKTKTFHWLNDKPHPTYLYVLAAGPYVVLKDSLGSLPINYWVYPKAVPDAMRSFHKTPEIVAFFNREYGVDYPWDKYDQVTIPGIGGGAESTSATVLGQSTIHDERAEQDFSSHWLVAHEAAHQWWGDLVTMRDWTHAWINESFATYGEYLWSRHDLGADEGAVNLLNKKNAYLNEAKNRYTRPIVFNRWNRPNDMFDRHLYQKGAVVLHMLRDVLGDEPFRQAMSIFLKRHAFGAADTNDLINAIRTATGQDPQWFFDQWLYGAGHPIFEVESAWNAQKKKLRLRVAQVQKQRHDIGVFRVPVDIRVASSKIDSVRRFWMNDSVETIEWTLPEKPLLVRFDANNVLLKELRFKKSPEELIYQLENDDVIGRAWAATELGKLDDCTSCEKALTTASEHDPFWFVRKSAVEALPKSPKLIKLLERVSLDKNSKVRVAALKALGKFERPQLASFLKTRFAEDDSYLAQAEALRALGGTGDENDIEFLEKAAQMKSPRNVVARAAKQAIEQNKK